MKNEQLTELDEMRQILVDIAKKSNENYKALHAVIRKHSTCNEARITTVPYEKYPEFKKELQQLLNTLS